MTAVLATLACLAAAPVARGDDPGGPGLTGSSVTIEGFGGWQNLQLSTGSVGNAVAGNEGTGIVGGDVLGKIGLLGIGVTLDKTLGGNGGQPWAGGLMLGLLFDVLPSLRLEALAEGGRYGGPNFDDMFSSSGVWYVGLRPGVSFRLLPSPIRLGISGLVRWPETGSGSHFGSPNYGIIGRVGFEFP